VKYYIFTYGCQMNKNDSEMVSGILKKLRLGRGKKRRLIAT